MKPKIAIACQGGGSQTAFTAGVLKALSENNVQDNFEIVGMSGTSGGAICAFLLWYALKKHEKPVCNRLIDFWHDNMAHGFRESTFNNFAIEIIRMIGGGLIPQFNLSPASPLLKIQTDLACQGLRPEFVDFRVLLNKHVDFQEVASWGPQTKSPVLILGACDVLSGRLRKFSSYLEPMKIEHILASACVPTLFPAVTIDDTAYWDGLFSDNPPIASFTEPDLVGIQNIPNEIWVIKINPTTTNTVPTTATEIIDRRNELAGNISLFHGLRQIERINNFLLAGAFTEEFLKKADVKEPIKIPKSFRSDPDKPYHIPLIEISLKLSNSLTYESKLDRSPEHINRLIRDGETQGRAFLEARLQKVQH